MNAVIESTGKYIDKEEYRHREVLVRINKLYNLSDTYVDGALNAAAKILVETLPFKEKYELAKYLETEIFRPIDWEKAKESYESMIQKTRIKPIRKPLFGDKEYDYDSVRESIQESLLSILNIDDNDSNRTILSNFMDNVTAAVQGSFSFKKSVGNIGRGITEELSFDNKHCEMWHYLMARLTELSSVRCILGKKGSECQLECPIKMYELAIQLIQKNDYDGAYDVLKEAINIAPNYEINLYWLGYVYYKKKDYAHAIEIMEKVYESSGFDGLAGLKLIDVYYESGNIEKALEQFLEYTEKCSPKIHPDIYEKLAFRTVSQICKEEDIPEDIKIKVYDGIKKMRSAEGMVVAF